MRRRRSIFKSRTFWISVAFFFVLCLLVYLSVFCNLFQIKEVEVRGTKKVSRREVEEITEGLVERKLAVGPWDIFSTKGLLILRARKIEEVLSQRYLRIKDVNVRRSLPDKTIVEIEERSSLAEVCRDRCYSVDETGFSFVATDYKESMGEEVNVFQADPKLVVVVIKDSRKIGLGQQVISPSNLTSILEVQRFLGERLGDLELSLEEEKLTARNGLNIYFDLGSEVGDQLENLDLLLEKKLKNKDLEKLEYIDLRFGSRVFYR